MASPFFPAGGPGKGRIFHSLECGIYFKPFPPIKKDIFQIFFNFFQGLPHQTEGQEEQSDQKYQTVGQQVAQRENPGTEREEVNHRAAKQRQQNVDAHLTPRGGDYIEKQSGGDRRPEQQIQKGAQQGQAQPAP
ncbi:MAG: hypothetical protein ACI4O5_08190 [Oscillospiraceae bacterium]